MQITGKDVPIKVRSLLRSAELDLTSRAGPRDALKTSQTNVQLTVIMYLFSPLLQCRRAVRDLPLFLDRRLNIVICRPRPRWKTSSTALGIRRRAGLCAFQVSSFGN